MKISINSKKTKTNDCKVITTMKANSKFHLLKVIVLIVVVLSIASLCLLKPIETARGDLAVSLDSGGLENAFNDQMGGGSSFGSSSSMSGGGSMGGSGSLGGSGSMGGGGSTTSQSAASNLQQQAQQFFDPSKLLDFGMNPMKYITPNTYQGMSSDLGNGYAMLSSGVSQALRPFQSQYGSSVDQYSNRYNSAQQSYLNRQEQLFQQQEALMSRMYEIFNNPEQFCRQMSDRRQSTMQQSSQPSSSMLDQTNQQSNSFMKQLSNSFPVFG